MDTEVFVTMCDANARVGSVQSSWISPMKPEKENQHGRQLHQMLEELDQMASKNIFLAGWFLVDVFHWSADQESIT